MKGISPKQREILLYISDFISKNGFSPSYREIMHYFDYSSLGSVYKHIQILKRKGLLNSEENCSRSLMPQNLDSIKKSSGEVEIPLIGNFTAGKPIDTFPRIQTIAVPEGLIHQPDKSYALRAQGDQLKKALIAEGDIMIVETRAEIIPGDLVLAQLHHHETHLRRYYPEGQYIRLDETSGEGDPFYIRQEEVAVQGVLTSVLRIYS